MREYLINENDSGQRLDKFITKIMPKLPKSMLYKGLRKKCVKLNGKHIKDGALFLNVNDKLNLYFKDEFFSDEKIFKPVAHKLDVVFEDENILIINKAVGCVVHADENNKNNTLVDMVRSYLFDNGDFNPDTEHSFKPALCNRIDRNTGGLVIAAKNAASLREMNKRIRNREVRKFYNAIVEGVPKEKGHLGGFSSRNDKLTTISENAEEDSKEVSLDYDVIASRGDKSLVNIELHTGRTHQIRAQFAAAGFPLAGDTKYGGHGGIFRQVLWSVKLIFEFKDNEGCLAYLNGKSIEVKAPFVDEFLGG